MKKTLTYFFLLFIATQQLVAQSSFSKVYYGGGSGPGACYGYKFVKGFTNDFYLCGQQNGVGMIAHIDSVGNKTWDKAIASNSFSLFSGLTTTQDSALLAVGFTKNPVSLKKNSFVVKYTTAGDTIWTKTFGGANNEELYSVCQAADSSYYMTGAVAYSSSPDSKIVIMKIAADGSLLWRKEVVVNNWTNHGYSVKPTADSGCVVMAETEQYTGTFQIYASLIKFNAAGNIDWCSNLFRGTNTFGKDVEVMTDGYICSMGIDNYAVIAKTDLAGNVLWSKKYPSYTGSTLNEPQAKIHVTSGNNLLFSTGCINGCNNPTNNVIQIDQTGNVLWIGSFFINGIEAYETDDHGFIAFGNGPLMGVIHPVSSPGYDPQIGLVKISSPLAMPPLSCFNLESSFYWNDSVQQTFSTPAVTTTGTQTSYSKAVTIPAMLTYDGCVSMTGSTADLSNTSIRNIYPNPFTEQTTVEFSGTQEEGKLIVTDIGGRKVLEQIVEASTQQVTLEKGKLLPGIYFLSFTSTIDNSIQKLIIQ